MFYLVIPGVYAMGYSLSPSLSIIVMEALSKMMSALVDGFFILF